MAGRFHRTNGKRGVISGLPCVPWRNRGAAGWTVAAGDLTFTVTPVIQDQELPQSVPIYWEGAALVSGSAGGRAYVELTGYCPAL